MAEYNKQRYYWIKLTDRFMTSDTVDFLMEQKDGANYVVLYQMLCLKTVNNDGKLTRQIGELIIPYDEEKIQRDMKWFSIDTIRVAMQLYKKLGLIYEQENGVLRTFGCSKNVKTSKRDRSSLKYKDWRAAVFKRDKYTCKMCGSKKNLQAHHIIPWRDCNENQKYNVDNGITLCENCHLKAHNGNWRT